MTRVSRGNDGARQISIGGARKGGVRMNSSNAGKGKEGALSPHSARARLEEAMGKLDLTKEEATPLVLDDIDDGEPVKWSLVGKVLH